MEVTCSGGLGKPAGSEERVRTKPRMYFSDWVSAKGIEFAKLKPRSQELAKLREEWMFEMAVDGH